MEKIVAFEKVEDYILTTEYYEVTEEEYTELTEEEKKELITVKEYKEYLKKEIKRAEERAKRLKEILEEI
jgi:hypothetical protein